MGKHPLLLHSGQSNNADTLLHQVKEFNISKSTTSSASTIEDTATAVTLKEILCKVRPDNSPLTY